MEEKQRPVCDRCKIEMELIEAKFSYLERAVHHKVPRCVKCGFVYVPEDLASGRMSEVEAALEDK